MSFKVVWRFGDGDCESGTFDDELKAREEGSRLSTVYAREYGTCDTALFRDEQLILDMRETHCVGPSAEPNLPN